MSVTVTKNEKGLWEVRWREGGRGSKRPKRTFKRKGDADVYADEVRRRKQLGELALFAARARPLRELAREWWRKHAVPNLAEHTLDGYEPVLAKHIVPRLGDHRIGEVTPEVVAEFRAQLERAGVGRHAVRLSLVVLQAMFAAAVRWGWVAVNPVKAVEKPSGEREREIVCLAPAQVEAIRGAMLAKEQLYAATMASLVAYQGLRTPEELLALEVKHVRANTLLVRQRNIKGKIVGGQKVRGFHPRSIKWVEPARRDVTEYLLAMGIRKGLVFPRADGQPWKPHDYKNWTRRVWHPAVRAAAIDVLPRSEDGKSSGLPPYDLRHAFASLQVRAGVGIPEIAEWMGHSPARTIATYTHVIRELEGEPRISAEEQIELARAKRAPRLREVEDG